MSPPISPLQRLAPCDFNPDYLGVQTSDAWHFKETPLFSFTNHEAICFYDGGGMSLFDMGFPARDLPTDLYVHVRDRDRALAEIQARFMDHALKDLIKSGDAAKVKRVFTQLLTDAFETPRLEVLLGFSGMVDSVAAEVTQRPEFLQAFRMTAGGGYSLAGHSVNLMALVMSFAVRQNLAHDRVVDWALAGLLHDVGKRFLSPEVAEAQHRLSDEEFAEYQLHPGKGFELMAPGNLSEELLAGILHHHERLDGSGYPQGIRKVPDLALVLGMADDYDALTSHYNHTRRGRDPMEVLRLLKGEVDLGKFPAGLFTDFAYSLTK